MKVTTGPYISIAGIKREGMFFVFKDSVSVDFYGGQWVCGEIIYRCHSVLKDRRAETSFREAAISCVVSHGPLFSSDQGQA